MCLSGREAVSFTTLFNHSDAAHTIGIEAKKLTRASDESENSRVENQGEQETLFDYEGFQKPMNKGLEW